jgi:AcrR family transcriptional regulator
MARVVKAHAVRRNEILDAARRLMRTKGYEQMAIQDILDDQRIAKGTFYHYFDSKHALIEALIGRLGGEAEQLLTPIVDDPHLPAIDKLLRLFDTMGRWKTARKPFLVDLLRVWYADDNASFRDKMRTAGRAWMTPLLAAIIRQGVGEGVFTTAYPDQFAEAIQSLMHDLSDTLARQLLALGPRGGDRRPVVRAIAAYTDAIERVLGAPKGSICLMDARMVEEWFPSPEERV